MKNTMCCITDCTRKAVEMAAPNVPYCAIHASRNAQGTKNYMSRMRGDGFGHQNLDSLFGEPAPAGLEVGAEYAAADGRPMRVHYVGPDGSVRACQVI